MKPALLICLLGLLAFVGCSTPPVKTKTEIRGFPKGKKELLVGNWQELARYWDEHAQKLSVDFVPASRLAVFQDTATAEIVVEGQFGIYGLIELHGTDERHTVMSCFVTGGIDRKIEEWASLLRAAQKKEPNQ